MENEDIIEKFDCYGITTTETEYFDLLRKIWYDRDRYDILKIMSAINENL